MEEEEKGGWGPGWRRRGRGKDGDQGGGEGEEGRMGTRVEERGRRDGRCIAAVVKHIQDSPNLLRHISLSNYPSLR